MTYPLCIASENGHTDVVRLLLENKADPNFYDAEVSYSVSCFSPVALMNTILHY